MLRLDGPVLPDTLSNWTTLNPIINRGVIAVVIDTFAIKIGNGINRFADLSYVGGGYINNKAIQSDREPNNAEHMIFCSSSDKWTYRLFACKNTKSTWASDSTVFPTYTILLELNDSTNLLTGRVKFSDGLTPSNSIPWFGNISFPSAPTIGSSIKWDGSEYIEASYLGLYDVPASTVPHGYVARDDGTWYNLNDIYVSCSGSSTENNIVIFDAATNTIKDSGYNLSNIFSSTTSNTFIIGSTSNGITLKNNSGQLDIKNIDDSLYADIKVKNIFCEFASVTTTLFIGYPTSETTSVSITTDGLDLYADGYKMITERNQPSNKSILNAIIFGGE